MLTFENGVTFVPRSFLFEHSFTLVTSLMRGMSHSVSSHSSSNFKAQVRGYLVSFRTSSNAKSQSSVHLKCPHLRYFPINSLSLYSDPQFLFCCKNNFSIRCAGAHLQPCTCEVEAGGLGIQIHRVWGVSELCEILSQKQQKVIWIFISKCGCIHMPTLIHPSDLPLSVQSVYPWRTVARIHRDWERFPDEVFL